MDELVKVAKLGFGGEKLNSVNLRDIHAYLEVGKDFSTWAKDKLDGFQEGEDFLILSLPKNGEAQNMNNSCNKKEYAVTVDVAKEICMLQKNEKGRELRKYFIDCEKKLNEKPRCTIDFSDPVVVSKLYIEAEEGRRKLLIENQAQQKLLEEAKPKIDFYDRFCDPNRDLSVADVAKIYQKKDFGRNDLFSLLRDKKFLIPNGRDKNVPYQKYMDKGWFSTRLSMNDAGMTFITTMVKRKGFEAIIKVLDKHFDDCWKDRFDENEENVVELFKKFA